jgi:hypothetical protein
MAKASDISGPTTPVPITATVLMSATFIWYRHFINAIHFSYLQVIE